MKTAAAIILVIALIGMFPKHKKKKEQPVYTPPAISQSYNAQCSQTVDQSAVERIVRHARAIRPRSGQSDQELTQVATAIVTNSAKYCIEPELGAALIARESAYNPRATSPHGACGLGQLMPTTARNMGISDCYDIDQNAAGSLAYFKAQLDRWNGYDDQIDRALVSYLLGPGNVGRSGVDWSNGTVRRYLQDIYDYRNKIKSY